MHHPDSGTGVGSDHHVVVTGVEDGMVRFHDPHGHPYATLPTDDFLTAWRAAPTRPHPHMTPSPGALKTVGPVAAAADKARDAATGRGD